MSDKDRADFDEWDGEASKGECDLQEELYKYGKNDVFLLHEASMKCRDEFFDCTGIEPFSWTTLASCCMTVYKTHHLPSDTSALAAHTQ